MKKLIAGITTIVFLSVPALASLTVSKMDFENRLRERVQSIAAKADPTAFAQVQIKLRKIRSNLSFLGLETHVTPLENGQDIGPESIEEIDVKVLSKLDPFPEWLKKEIATTVEMENVKVNVIYAKPDSPIKDVYSQLTEFFTNDLYSTVNLSLKWAIWLSAFTFLMGAGIGWVLFNFSKKLEAILQKVIAENLVPMATALGQMAGGVGGVTKNPVQSAKKETSASEAPRMVMPSDSKNQFEHFSITSLVALFVDCYWTKMDGYAHYLWTQLKPNQREALMKSDAVDSSYFSYVVGVPPRPEDYHSHAWYMNPHSAFDKVDQKSLTTWLKAHLDLAHMVSPMRSDYAELSLEERLKIASQSKRGTGQVGSLSPSTPRVFAPKLRLATLSVADELYLFKNYAKVSIEARSQIKTLVWLALVPIEKRRKILDQLDARQIAEAWTAPKEILEELKKCLPAKKLEMLEHFLKSSEPDRSNDTFAYLVTAGLEALQTAPEVKAAA